MPSSSRNGQPTRQHASLMQEALQEIEDDPKHHIAGSLALQTPPTSALNSPQPSVSHKLSSPNFLNDLITMKWMRRPSSSFKLLVLPIILYAIWAVATPQVENPWSLLLFPSNRLPDSPQGFRQYAKSYWDIAFIAYYIVVFSFVRQSMTIYVLKPLARHYGVRKEAKLDRFAEQGYAIFYFSISTCLGVYTMYNYMPTWFYKTEYFWINYPHWDMPGTLKVYYLLQTAYWTQQFLVLVLKLEKPRSDYAELVAHHIVTLWLIFWSYLVNLTYIGNAVFITMDVSDVFLALSKVFNYLHMEKTKTVAFAWFTCVWTYTRHYLNLLILWSVWNEFHLIPNKNWDPEQGAWLAPWMRYQIFLPISLLQLINLFWYFLIWRILLRAVFSSTLDDERSDDEDEEPHKKE